MGETTISERSILGSWLGSGTSKLEKLRNVATGETLFNALVAVLETHNIPWKNVIGFASDSASVMVGKRNSVLSRVIIQQPDVFFMGCVCHLAALCAAAGLKKLPLSIDDLLIDMYYRPALYTYFDREIGKGLRELQKH